MLNDCLDDSMSINPGDFNMFDKLHNKLVSPA